MHVVVSIETACQARSVTIVADQLGIVVIFTIVADQLCIVVIFLR